MTHDWLRLVPPDGGKAFTTVVSVTMLFAVFGSVASGATLAVLVAVDELLPELVSVVDVAAAAVLLSVEPLASPALAWTTIWKVALAPAARVAIEPLTVPELPSGGFVKLNAGPAVCISET